MITFDVQDMTCGHCAGTITRALREADPDAQVTIDLARHLVRVASARADARALGEAIAAAGYTPIAVQAATGIAPPQRAGGGCCCGGR